MVSKTWPIIGIVVGVIVLLLGILLNWVILPVVINKQIAESTQISRCSDSYSRWEELPQPLHLKVSFFNVSNPDEVHDGGLPIVNEVGPYVYKYYKGKQDIVFSENGESVSYKEKLEIVFDREATSSELSEDDEITIASPLTNGIPQILQMTMVDEVQLRIMDLAIQSIFNEPTHAFLTTTPKEVLLDGYKFCINASEDQVSEIVCNEIKLKESRNIVIEENYFSFSFFGYKLRDLDGPTLVSTGTCNSKKTQDIQSRHDSPLLDVWGDRSIKAQTCNRIRGTDGSRFQPFIKKNGVLTAFSSDICQSVDLHYDGTVDYKGITGYRHTPRAEFLQNVGPEYDNECYCLNNPYHVLIKPNGCLYSGAVDMTLCVAAPIIATNPHMYNTAQEYTSLVTGQEPNREKHLTFIEVEPHTGYPLRGGKRIQFNIFVRPVQHISLLERYTPVLTPIFWVEEGIELNDKVIGLLNEELFDTLKTVSIVVWIIIGVGIALILGMGAWTAWISFSARKKNF